MDEKDYAFLSYDAKNINSHQFKNLHTEKLQVLTRLV